MELRKQVVSIISAMTGKDNIVPVPTEFVRMCGDYNSAAILNQILYWSGRTENPDGWFYKSYSQWEEELALTRYQVRRAVKGDSRTKAPCLEDFGVETKLAENPYGQTMLHYRINSQVFYSHLLEHLSSKYPENIAFQQPLNNVDRGGEQCRRGGGNNVDGGGIQCNDSSLTESTAKSTTKKKQKPNTFSPDGELDLTTRMLLVYLLTSPENSTHTNKNATTQSEQTPVQERDIRQTAQKRKKSSAKKKKKVPATAAAAPDHDVPAAPDTGSRILQMPDADSDTPDSATPDEPESADATRRELNDRYQEITSRAFGLQPGAMTGKLVKFFRGRATLSKKGNETEYTIHQPETAWTPEEIGGLWIWYWNHPRYGGRDGIREKARYLPRTVSILRDRMDEFRASEDFEAKVEKARRRLDELMAGDESAADIDEYQSDLPEGYYDNFAPIEHADPNHDPWAGVDEEEKQRQIAMMKELMSV